MEMEMEMGPRRMSRALQLNRVARRIRSSSIEELFKSLEGVTDLTVLRPIRIKIESRGYCWQCTRRFNEKGNCHCINKQLNSWASY